MQLQTQTGIFTYMLIIYVCMYIHTYMQVGCAGGVRATSDPDRYIYIFIILYIHIYIHTHTYIHTYMNNDQQLSLIAFKSIFTHFYTYIHTCIHTYTIAEMCGQQP
jgi:hypothetical protein